MKIAIALIAIALCGCATKKPGGRSDFWTTATYLHEDIIFNCVGIRF